LPTEELKLQFIDLMPTAGPRLSAYVDAIDDVLTVALSENLLVTDWETIDGRERPVLSFYHHRLQEYYAAEYIGRFEPVIDWTTHYDDIWWQEVLITLSGIVANPQQLIGDLVASFPARPLVCYQFGEVLAGNRREVLSSDLSFYFLKDVRELSEEECRSYLRETLGIREAPYSWKLMSPEPDEYESADAVRRWLERHNARLLDRLQLAVECARNCTATISSDIQHRISSVLRRFVEFGNQMEIVRCIGIGALLQKSDLYAIVEPALIGGSAWVRREAMEALAIYPITGAVHLRPVGFVIFLQFLRGELLYSIPRLWRSTVAQRKLVWFWPGIAFLIILSFIGALLPFCLYYLLLYLFPTGPRGFTDSLGLTWTRWAWALTALGVITTYSVKYRYGLSIVRTTLVIGSVLGALAIAPVLIGHVPASLSVGERAKITNVASVLHDVPQMMRIGIAFVGTGVFAIAAQTVEVIAVTTLACICFLNFRSPYLFSAAWTYAQDSLHSRSNLDKFQIAWGVIEGSGAAACFLLALLSLTIFSAVAWLADHAMYVIYAAGVVGGLIAIVLLLQICSEVGRHLTIFFKRPRHEQLTFVARTVAGAFLLLVGLRLLYYFFSWVVLPIWRFLVVHAVLLVYLLVLTALCLFSVVIAYPMLREARDLIMFLAVRYLGVKTRDETAVPTLQTERTARALTEAAIAHSLSSSRTRYDRLRQLLRYIKPQWARAWVYQRLRETHQEIRQDSLPRDAGGEEAR